MLFSSPVFLLFFAIYYVLHLAAPKRARVYLIVAGSTVFYGWWNVAYVWLPYLLMAIAYGGGRWIAAAEEEGARRRRTIAAVALLFAPLLAFKYANFLYRDVVGLWFDLRGELWRLPLPLGVSFVTFTLTAYMVDVYRRLFPGDSPPATVLAYVLFFPHLIAGPILRPGELIPQLGRPQSFRRGWVLPAVAIFTLGLFKKLVMADPTAELVQAVYDKPGLPRGPEALFAIYGFSLQIYCDFSGYTDMAIGVALLLGIRLPNNFLQPYRSRSLVEFWRRWHITLSFWLRDYLYIPLGGSRRGFGRQLVNVMITMTLGGLWHGANWTFVVWGALHGAGISLVHLLRRLGLPRLPGWLGLVLTFHFVALAWVFFRAPNLGRAGEVLRGLGTGGWDGAAALAAAWPLPAALIPVFLLTHAFDDHRRVIRAVRRAPKAVVWPVLALCWMLAVTVSQGSSAKFVYFDF